MIERRHRQRNLFEAVIGSVEEIIEGLIEPRLRRLDEILADETLLDAVMQELARRRPQSRSRGRPGTPGEVALRMLVLKRIKGWSFDETEHEVRQNLVYRHLTRVYFERVPDAKTLIRLSAVVGAEGVDAIHRRLVEMAREHGLIKGRCARVDTTVVETNIRYPSDSRLLQDGVRVLTRAFKRIEQATGVVGGPLRNRMRATTHRVLEIARAARSRAGQGRARLEQGYGRLLSTVRSTVRDAQRVCAELASGARGAVSATVTSSQAQLEHFVPLVNRVIAQTQARIFHNDTHYPDKLFSLFEPHTEAIRKGKAAKPTEFGKLLKVQEAEHQIVIDYQVYEQRAEDQSLLVATIEAHVRTFGRAPHLLAADRGFWSAANKRAAMEKGVEKVCIPALGKLKAEQAAEQRQRWFRRGQRWRVGCEGRISVLKRRDGLTRCRYHGLDGMKRWVGWGVVSNNLHVLMNSATPARRRHTPQTEAGP
jgi:IS5 family transposase